MSLFQGMPTWSWKYYVCVCDEHGVQEQAIGCQPNAVLHVMTLFSPQVDVLNTQMSLVTWIFKRTGLTNLMNQN